MPRLAGIDIPERKKIYYALQYIHGIGAKVAKDILAKLAPYANEIDGKSTPRSFETLLKDDLDNWAAVVKAANIKPD